MDELKRVPAWGWIVVGLVLVGVLLALRKGSKKATTIGQAAQPQAQDLSALTSTDTTQGNAALEELLAIRQDLEKVGQKSPTVPTGVAPNGLPIQLITQQQWEQGQSHVPGSGAGLIGPAILSRLGDTSSVVGRLPWGSSAMISGGPISTADGWYYPLTGGGYILGRDTTSQNPFPTPVTPVTV
jgi:hypothetical protein